MKIAIVTCYDQVDHIRPRVLRRIFSSMPDMQALIIKNKHRGLLRYLEMPCRLMWLRLTQRPDAYLITFRGYEMLPLTLPLAGRKPVIFDEFINAVEYLREHGKLKPNTAADRLARRLYGWLVRRCRFVLADTDAHADLSAELSHADRARFVTVPVGAEESVFYPAKPTPHQGFTVFYYGVMVKLHGLDVFLDAATTLCKKYPDITFVVGGDNGKADALYAAAKRRGARLVYKPWFPYEDIPAQMHSADLCIGGPLGDTSQAQFVITTKTFQFLAAERPVLVGRNKVNAAFVDKQNCLVVPLGDAQAIVDAIAWAYDHPRQLAIIGREGRKLYEQDFSEACLAERMRALVEAL